MSETSGDASRAIAPMKTQSNIVREGWLFKRGEHVKNWRKRYFILRDDGSLIGFKTQPEPDQYSDPLNNFTVKNCQVMRQDRPRTFTFIVRGLQFAQVIERMFSVNTHEEREEWVAAIEYVDKKIRLDADMVKNASAFEQEGGQDKFGVTRGDAPSRVKLDSFDLLKVLGTGSFGKVMLCREKASGDFYAMKMLKKQVVIAKDEVAHTLTENRVLQMTSHPFLISHKYSFQTADLLCFVTEYVNGGELFFHLSRERIFPEEKTRFYGAEILLALEYLHAQGIIYRDLKLENLLLDRDGHVKMADFGLCKEDISFGRTTRTFCGTPAYLAPEVLDDVDYGCAVDWWGLGVVMYEMACGRLPFYNRDDEKMFELILTKDVLFPPTLSSAARSLLIGLLTKEPSKRLGGSERGAQEIKDHAFFHRVPWDMLLAKQITPPFTPQVTSDIDTRYFDPEITGECIELTPPDDRTLELKSISEELEQPHFPQFSYQGATHPV